MSVNRRISGSNGRLQPSMKSWKANEPLNGSNSPHRTPWRRKPLLLLIVFGVVIASVCFFLSFKSSEYLMSKEKEAACEESSRILLQRYNISKKQLHALASLFSGSDQIFSNCIDERRLQMLLSSGIASNPQLVCCPENQELQKKHRCFADTVEPIEQCPVLEDYVQTRLELSFPLKKYLLLASHSLLSSNLVDCMFSAKVESLLKLRNIYIFDQKYR